MSETKAPSPIDAKVHRWHAARASAIVLLALASRAGAQTPASWTVSGFVSGTAPVYATVPNEADTRALADLLAAIGLTGRVSPTVGVRASFKLRADTFSDVDEGRWLDLSQRGLQRPAGTVDDLYVDVKLGSVDLRLGNQQVRWGRADGVNPTDNVNPHDYLNPFSDERIAVPAVRSDLYVRSATVEGVWIPFFTPARLPRLNQRWFPRLPATVETPFGSVVQEVPAEYRDGPNHLPARTWSNGQWGVRWNQLVPGAGFSVSYFDGFYGNAYFTPLVDVVFVAAVPRAVVSFAREYGRTRVAGADVEAKLGPVGVRGELAFVAQANPDDPDRLIYIIGFDRAWKEWSIIVQYTDRVGAPDVTSRPTFPDLGLRSALLAHVVKTVGSSQRVEVKSALRLRGGDVLLQPLYSRSLTDHWQVRVLATVIAGSRSEYLGQYRGNSYAALQLRYAF